MLPPGEPILELTVREAQVLRPAGNARRINGARALGAIGCIKTFQGGQIKWKCAVAG